MRRLCADWRRRICRANLAIQLQAAAVAAAADYGSGPPLLGTMTRFRRRRLAGSLACRMFAADSSRAFFFMMRTEVVSAGSAATSTVLRVGSRETYRSISCARTEPSPIRSSATEATACVRAVRAMPCVCVCACDVYCLCGERVGGMPAAARGTR
jgi:hypothetical protein